MPLDYKYTREDGPRRRWRNKFLFILLVFFLVAVVAYGFGFYQTRKSDERILTGQYSEALQTLHYWKSLPLISGRVHERIGTAELLWHGKNQAESNLRKSEEKAFFAPVDFWQEVLMTLWTHARYEDGFFYTEYLQKAIGEKNVLRFYRSGFLAGINQLDEAEKELTAAGNISELAKEISILREEIELRASTGQYTFLYDRENLPIVSSSLDGAFTILYEPVKPLFVNPSGDYLAKLNDRANRQATTTLDYRIQNAALKALEKYAGAIVLLDVENGDILAAASSLKGHNTLHPPGTSVATHVQYEPGSIIKMMTLAGALESRANPEELFPMKCEGTLKLSDNRILYDWKMHKEVKDINVATAVSCNVSFAKIGLAMKPADLLTNLRTLGFDEKLKNSYLPLELGKIIQSDVNEEYLAKLSIGLEFLKMTPLHAAMVSSAIANEGLSMMPRLLLHYRNLIGVPYSASKPSPFRTFMSKETASKITKAMEHVVLYEEGTGRRAAVGNLPIAMKTGTAGDGATGYDAIIIGFAPVINPKVAFSVVVEHSGKAEFEGARITKLFLESIQGYIQ